MTSKHDSLDTDRAVVIGLSALGWVLQDQARSGRLLDLTGLTPEILRSSAHQPAVLAAILAFLEAHEPDLVSCAEALAVAPTDLVAARAKLEGARP